MKFAIPGKYLGRNNSLIIDGDSFQWHDTLPDAIPLLGPRKAIYSSIENCAELLNVKLPDLFGDHIREILKIIGVSCESAPASMLHRKDKFKIVLDQAIEETRSILRELEGCGYIETFLICQKILRAMSPCSVDYENLVKYAQQNKIRINKTMLESFRPNKYSIMNPAIYTNTKTITGRMTIESGPKILIAPKEFRQYLRPQSKNGILVQADFVSLEPRVARLLYNKSAAGDLYQEILTTLFEDKLSREQVKLAVLCCLFGAGERKLKKVLPEDMKPKEVIVTLREYFGFDEVVTKKIPELKKHGKMNNYFGRPIIPSSDRNTVIFNNWLQSSAVDVSLLGFSKLINQVKFATPMFLIHDAIIMDIPKDRLSHFTKICNIGIEVKDIGKFPMSVTVLSDQEK